MAPTRVASLLLGLAFGWSAANSLAETATANSPTARFAVYQPAGMATAQRVPGKAAATVAGTGDRCTTITFEGLGDSQFVPDFDDISLPGWISSYEDTLPGGHGNFNNEPSPVTTVFWVFGDPNNPSSYTVRDILFGNPVSSVSLYYASAFPVQLEAFDKDGTLITSVSGARNGPNGNNRYTTFTQLSVSAVGDKIAKVTFHGQAEYTGIDNLQVCRHPTINSVEVTQAIQEYQKIADLESTLNASGDPPVPIIEGKPAVMRIYFDKIQVSTSVKVVVNLNGSILNRTVTIPPSCSPDDQRRRNVGCGSTDFYFTPPSGSWPTTVTLRDSDDNQLETHSLPFKSHTPDAIKLRAVKICDGKDELGNWECEDDSVLPTLMDFLRRTAPTASVTADVTNHIVGIDRETYTDEDWWTLMAKRVNGIYLYSDAAVAVPGVQDYYFGVVSTRAPTGIGGIAHDIPAHGGGARSSALRLNVETNLEVIAHETGHMMGRRHTNNAVPAAMNNTPPGCYNFAEDPGTDWPFSDVRIQSDNQLEVGFDVAYDKPLQPETTFDWMSYCTPRWVSPFTYTNVLSQTLLAPGANIKAAAQTTVASFWTVGGVISGNAVTLDPLFVRSLQGLVGAGSGTWSIVVRNAGGSALFTRLFTPAATHTETTGTDVQGAMSFLELVPVQAGAAKIVVLDPGNVERASVILGGAAPSVAFTTPTAGAILQGPTDIHWTITDPDSNAFTSALEYSPDGGATWIILFETTQPTVRVDFSKLPGAKGNGRLRVFVSDGANTGSAISAPFGVPSHEPVVSIVGGERLYYRQGDVVWLRANAFDRDDGVLDGASVKWNSSRDGALGQGASLPVYTLTPGTHTITVTATDSDGNTASASEQITIAGAAPVITMKSNAAASGPQSCVEITIDAAKGSADVPLAAVRASPDGGVTFFDLDPAQLPATLVATSQGFYHIVAHVFDAAGQWDVKDLRFFTAADCAASNVAPVANAGSDRTVFTPAGPANVLLDGSASTDPDSDPGTNDDIVAFDWFEDFGLPGQASLGSGQQLQVPLAIGVHHISLRVTDHGNLTNVAQVTITVQAGSTPSSTGLVSSANPAVSGQAVTFTATVSGSGPSGNVTFKDGASTLCNAVPLSGGAAQCPASSLSVGSHSITAQYAGDANNAASVSPVLTQAVNKGDTTATISAHTPNPSASGAAVAVTVNVAVTAPGAGAATGSITVTDGAANCTITLPSTSCNLTLTGNGLRTLSATYGGNATLNGSTSALVSHLVGIVTLDVDASVTASKYDALTDGVLILRYLFGLTGTALTNGALGATASRTNPDDIATYLDGIHSFLDVDANGAVDAGTDGLMILRYLFGLRGASLTAGAIGTGANRDATQIADYIKSLMP